MVDKLQTVQGGAGSEVPVCPICHTASTLTSGEAEQRDIQCPRCGDFGVTAGAFRLLIVLDPRGRWRTDASTWIFFHQGIVLDEGDIPWLSRLRPPTSSQRGARVLRQLSYQFPNAGMNFVCAAADTPLQVAGSACDPDELMFLMREYLGREKGYLEVDSQYTDNELLAARITPKGWDLLDTLQEQPDESHLAFVAMWFSRTTRLLREEAIRPAIRRAGYEAVIMDEREHSNRIDDEIIAMIRRCKFIVADFTGQRGGVYFEAGVAFGQLKPVIWTCQKKTLKSLHFDISHFNFLQWTAGRVGGQAFAKALQNRIEAVIGRGPLEPPE